MELPSGARHIGLVPPKTRAARIDALRQVSDFAKQVGILQVQTHCGLFLKTRLTRCILKPSQRSVLLRSTARAMGRLS